MPEKGVKVEKNCFNQLDHFFDCAFASVSRDLGGMAVGGHVSQLHEIALKIVEKPTVGRRRQSC
jgi:hypothetical protein